MPTHAYTYLFTHHPHSHVQMPTQTRTAYPCSHALTHACTRTHTHSPTTRAHTLTYRHKVHTYIHVLTAGRHAHTCSHTFDHRGRKAETHRQKPRSEARHLLQESSAAQATPDPGGPSVPPSLWFPAASGCPLAAPKPQFQCHVPPVACNFSSLPSPLQSSCLPQHPLPGDHRTQTPASKQGLFPNDLMRFPLWRLSQSHWQDPPPLGGDMGTEAFHCPSNQRVCVSSSISSQGVAQRRIP